tara:strand:- start:998 stop:1984 length:987 start_codon:yes stop_codon:yes gene_type:complete
MPEETIKDIGEKELIKRLSYYMPNNQTSDDCGYLEIKHKKLLINTDLMVENTHFNKNIITAKDIGWKIATTNFSDLISSGCDEIIGINIGLILKPDTKWKWIKDLYDGINEALKTYGGSIIGGDCSRGDTKSISLTAIGKQGPLLLRRYSCEPGEILFTSGPHGLSKLGYLVKNDKNMKNKLAIPTELIESAINAFSRPKPKLQTLKNIVNSKKESNKNQVGCTDSSDGLYQALLDLSYESKCNAVIDYNKLPKDENWPKGKNWDEYYLFGGEDYEILFSLPREWANNLLKIDNNVKEIGFLEKGNGTIKIENCPYDDLLSTKPFRHF